MHLTYERPLACEGKQVMSHNWSESKIGENIDNILKDLMFFSVNRRGLTLNGQPIPTEKTNGKAEAKQVDRLKLPIGKQNST